MLTPMAEPVEVDAAELHLASAHLVTAAGDHAAETARHMEDFADGVARWRGAASKQAMAEVAALWQERHTEHQRRVNALGDHVHEAARSYTGTDEESRDAVEAMPFRDIRMNLS